MKKFKVEGTPIQQTLNSEVNNQFGIEAMQLRTLADPYLLIVENGGLIQTSKDSDNYQFMKAHHVPKKRVDYLIGKEVIGIYKIDDKNVILYDPFDSTLSDASKHPKGIAACYELKKSGYHDAFINVLIDGIISRYDKLKGVSRRNPRESTLKYEDRLLSTAIVLTCDGKYQCPLGLKEHIDKAGGLKGVRKAGELIGEKLRYNSDERIETYLRILQLTFPKLKHKFTEKFRELWESEKAKLHSKKVNASYVGGLTWCASELTDNKLKKTEKAKLAKTVIANAVLTAPNALLSNAKEISERQQLSLFNENIMVAVPEKVSTVSK